MIKNVFMEVLPDVWPMLIIITVIISSFRITYLISKHKKFVLHKELIYLISIIYILCLFHVVTFQDNNYGTNTFVPFREIFRYDVNSRLFLKNVIGNVLLFVPFGIFVTYYVKNDKVYQTLFLSILVSCSIEFAQSVIGRTADIDDVILNTIGGIVGYITFKFGGKLVDKLPKFMKSQVFLDVLCLVIILFIIYLAFRFNFWRFLAWII